MCLLGLCTLLTCWTKMRSILCNDILKWVGQISPNGLQSCYSGLCILFLNCNKTFLTLTLTLTFQSLGILDYYRVKQRSRWRTHSCNKPIFFWGEELALRCLYFCVNCRHTCMNDKNILNEWFPLTHYGRVTHICVCKPTITGSDNGLSPWRRQAIIWTNAGILTAGVVNWEVIHQTANPSRTQQGYHWSPSWVLVTPHLKWQHICGT